VDELVKTVRIGSWMDKRVEGVGLDEFHSFLTHTVRKLLLNFGDRPILVYLKIRLFGFNILKFHSM
jgi:hypothetical protein